MSKIPVIIRREYLSRVKKKSFLLTTILLPLGFVLLIGGVSFFTLKSKSETKVGVIDESGEYFSLMKKDSKSYPLSKIEKLETESIAQLSKRTGNDIILHIFSDKPPVIDSVKTLSESSISLGAQDFLEDEVQSIYRKKLLVDANIDMKVVDSLEKAKIPFESQSFEEKVTNTGMSAALGYGMGFLMYMIIFVYGVGVMRGVMEEKTNRIAEVIISSVRPFELMLGKIIGIGLVGLTQFLLWGIVLAGLYAVMAVFMIPTAAESMSGVMNDPQVAAAVAEVGSDDKITKVFAMIASQNWVLIIFSFFVYFMGGYFLYAALFAAIGSLVNEDPQDAQQLTLPVMLPIILGFIILASSMEDPNSGLAVFGSIFPLTSPIVMLGRIPYDPPGWQIALSMVLLILSFLGTTWLSAKIYRIGILLYGKKVGWKEVFKWLRKA